MFKNNNFHSDEGIDTDALAGIYVPYTGATADVVLGNNSIIVSKGIVLRDSFLTTVFNVDGSGNVTLRNGTSNLSSTLAVKTGSSAAIGITVKGSGSQTGDLQRWTNISDTLLARVDSAGAFYPGGTGQSLIASGLWGNSDMGSSAADDTKFSSNGERDAFLIDASADTAEFNVNLYLKNVKTGATQAGAGANAGEVWATASHATLPDNVLMMGV
jgi:hypothetical protein